MSGHCYGTLESSHVVQPLITRSNRHDLSTPKQHTYPHTHPQFKMKIHYRQWSVRAYLIAFNLFACLYFAFDTNILLQMPPYIFYMLSSSPWDLCSHTCLHFFSFFFFVISFYQSESKEAEKKGGVGMNTINTYSRKNDDTQLSLSMSMSSMYSARKSTILK